VLHSSKRKFIEPLLQAQLVAKQAKQSFGFGEAWSAPCSFVRQHTAAIPWDFLIEVFKTLFDLPLATQMDVVSILETTTEGLLSIEALPVRVRKSTDIVLPLFSGNIQERTIVLLAGDAKVSRTQSKQKLAISMAADFG